VLAGQLLQVVIQTPGGPQTIEVLTAWAIPTWLAGLNPEMVAPEKRPMILKLKLEAADVLYRYFFKIDTKPAGQGSATSHTTEPAQEPAGSQHATPSAWERFFGGLDQVTEAARDLKREQQAREAARDAQLARIEQRVMQGGPLGFWPTSGADEQPLGKGTLAPLRQVQLLAMATSLRERMGTPIAATCAELAEVFGVRDFTDIPDAGWEVVQDWFWQHWEASG